jgi:hypothetical protein
VVLSGEGGECCGGFFEGGVWWLEYGRADLATGRTEYLTTGLWLRSSGQALLRAFFLVPCRVRHQLTLHVDRNPIGIGGLAEQLAAHGAHDLMFPPDLAIRAWPDRSATTS